MANHLAKRLQKAGIKVTLMITVDAANGWGSNNVDRTISDNVEKNINYYEENQGVSTGDPTLSHGAANKGGPNTKIKNRNKSDDTFHGEEMDHMNIDDATMKEVIQKLADVLKGLKEGENKTLSREEIQQLFKH